MRLGATPEAGGTRFAAWTSTATRVQVRLHGSEGPRDIPLEPRGEGVFEGFVRGVGPGALYTFVLDGRDFPDPYARFLPRGVHGPAEVMAEPRAVPGGRGPFELPPLHRLVLYELHVGTFTPEGTYRAAAARLPDLRGLGVNALELMPLSSFAGARGWGYDGVAHFAPHAPYGRPEELCAFIDAAHREGLGVLLDVVYNHFGPSGNYLGAYAPEYFHDADTPWGQTPSFEHPRMRAYVLENARLWLATYGFDGLRLDATHALHDASPKHIVAELAELGHALHPRRLVVAEDERNDPALIERAGLDAVWADDFHHVLEVLLTGERDGYYAAYTPSAAELARTIERGWLYEGQVYPTWGRPRGAPAGALSFERFIYSVQNHDQVGNRALGTRLSQDAGPDGLALASAVLLFLPMTPLLFMGQEWGASSPFLFFTDQEPELGAKIREGRRAEFSHFAAFADPALREQIPDPQAASTFEKSKLSWEERAAPPHRELLALTAELLRLRREDAVLATPAARGDVRAFGLEQGHGQVLTVVRAAGSRTRTLVANFGESPFPVRAEWGPVLLRTRQSASTADRAAVESIPGRSAAIFALD